jgi:hypothetical protein
MGFGGDDDDDALAQGGNSDAFGADTDSGDGLDSDGGEAELPGPEPKKAKVGGRPSGAAVVHRVLHGEYATKKAAIAAGKAWSATDTVRFDGGSWLYAARCRRHDKCPVRARHILV